MSASETLRDLNAGFWEQRIDSWGTPTPRLQPEKVGSSAVSQVAELESPDDERHLIRGEE